MIFEVVVTGLPPGLGSYTLWDKRLDARLVRALVSVPAVKGAEVGTAFDNCRKPGTTVHDEIFRAQGLRGSFRTAPAISGNTIARPTAQAVPRAV